MAVLKKGAFQCALVEALVRFSWHSPYFKPEILLRSVLILMAAIYIGAHAHVPDL